MRLDGFDKFLRGITLLGRDVGLTVDDVEVGSYFLQMDEMGIFGVRVIVVIA